MKITTVDEFMTLRVQPKHREIKVSKHLKFKTLQDIDRGVIEKFMQQALELDAK